MERVIKFRALKDDMSNCNYVYGCLVYDHGGVPRISTDGLTFHTCLKETVGQFTGLHDKHGKEIYEGDIIEKYQFKKSHSNDKKCKVRYIVEWYMPKTSDTDYNNEVLSKDPSSFNEEPGFRGKQIYNDKKYNCHGWSEFANCQIIGSIHTNPELINQK